MTTIAERTKWWHPVEDGKVVCTLCPRECHIPRGSRGFCFVRENVDGHLELSTYGRSSGFCIDPVEKKPLNHFLPGTPILSFGTAGCNLGCKFCQNWDISKSRSTDATTNEASPEAIVEAAIRTGCKSLAFTYNDPVIWAEYAIDIAKVARQAGIKTVAVTAGYIQPEARAEFYKHMDAANVDIKGFTETFYRKLCQAQLKPILETIEWLKKESNTWVELTNLMIPGENDSESETAELCDWIVKTVGPDMPIHFTAFHSDYKMMDTPSTPPETLSRAYEIAVAAGIRYVYVGNVHDVARQSTFCHACKKPLIERDWHQIGRYHMKGNRCGHCGVVIPGIFEEKPGTWGRKRLPIRIQTKPAPVTGQLGGSGSGDGVVDQVRVLPSGGGAGELVTITSTMAKPRKTQEKQVDSAPKPAVPPVTQAATSLVKGQARVEFSEAEAAQMLTYARAVVRAAANGTALTATIDPVLAASPIYGLFVSLTRGGALRACRGSWGGQSLFELGKLLVSVSADSTLRDTRFPRIMPGEVDLLELELNIMFDPHVVAARGAARADGIVIGTHGMVLSNPRGRGLLLPHVPVQGKMNVTQYFETLSQKAGLDKNAWLEEASEIMTFRATVLTEHPLAQEFDPKSLRAEDAQALLALGAKMVSGNSAEVESGPLATKYPEELGLFVQTVTGQTAAAMGPNHSLASLMGVAVKSLLAAAKGKATPVSPVSKFVVFHQPIALAAADYPARHGTLVSRAVLARVANGPAWTLILPGNRTDKIGDALAAIGMTPQQWHTGVARLTAFSTLTFDATAAMTAAAARAGVAPANLSAIRPPARANQFYPGNPAQMNAEIDGFLALANAPAKRSVRAVMLPHAGWRYCGATLARTIAGVQVPDTVIIIGPRHTSNGPPWSIASHQAWAIPGAMIPVDTELVRELAAAVPAMQVESDAHAMEHGTEVLLPFLYRLNPKLRIVPIVLGHAAYESTKPLADALAAVTTRLRNAGREVLLVISSDMNHFDSQEVGQVKDRLALDAMVSGRPQRLYEICRDNQISMCGMLPAATVMQALIRTTPVIAPKLVDYSDSAAASGDRSRVVGYAGVVIE